MRGRPRLPRRGRQSTERAIETSTVGHASERIEAGLFFRADQAHLQHFDAQVEVGIGFVIAPLLFFHGALQSGDLRRELAFQLTKVVELREVL